MRIGTGYDVHRLVEGRRCIIGGVDIPFEKGLDGHSDADVLLHAIMDALLGAAALGDIGKWFPDTDPAWEGADSVKLLQSVGDILAEHHYLIENIDATVIAQAVSVKATTEEHLGFTGKGEGISAQAAALLTSPRDLAAMSFEEAQSSREGCASSCAAAGSGGCPSCPLRQSSKS